MSEPEDFRPDPIFNDEEDRTPLPIGHGPTMTGGTLGEGRFPRGRGEDHRRRVPSDVPGVP